MLAMEMRVALQFWLHVPMPCMMAPQVVTAPDGTQTGTAFLRNASNQSVTKFSDTAQAAYQWLARDSDGRIDAAELTRAEIATLFSMRPMNSLLWALTLLNTQTFDRVGSELNTLIAAVLVRYIRLYTAVTVGGCTAPGSQRTL